MKLLLTAAGHLEIASEMLSPLEVKNMLCSGVEDFPGSTAKPAENAIGIDLPWGTTYVDVRNLKDTGRCGFYPCDGFE